MREHGEVILELYSYHGDLEYAKTALENNYYVEQLLLSNGEWLLDKVEMPSFVPRKPTLLRVLNGLENITGFKLQEIQVFRGTLNCFP